MPGIDGITEEEADHNRMNGNPNLIKSPKTTLSSHSSQRSSLDLPVHGAVDISIEELYENVCDMQSSDQSPSRHSLESYGEESRIDSELGHLVGGETIELQIMEEDANGSIAATTPEKNGISELELEDASKPTLMSKQGAPKKPSSPRNNQNAPKRKMGLRKYKNRVKDESGLENPELGLHLLKQARDLIASGENSKKALQLSLRAAKSIEICSNGKLSLDLVMSLHVTAAIYCSMGLYSDAIPVLEHSIEVIPVNDLDQEHALAKFAGYMQLGDTYSMLGKFESSIQCYKTGLDVQKRVLGDSDLQVGETCRFLAEAYVQALQFDEAQSLSEMALKIDRENGGPEAADRRLMGLICEAKGDHEAALEHLALASIAMISNGEEVEAAAVDLSMGDAYLSLLRYDEADFAYQKALKVLKTAKGEHHPFVASVFVRLTELYNKTGKFREAKSYWQNALQIYEKPPFPGIPPEEFAIGLTNVSAVYESMNEVEQAVNLLNKVLKIYNDAPGQQGTIAGIEAQMGVMYYLLGKHSESYNSLKSAVLKLRGSGEKKSVFLGVALNQMGLACVQQYAMDEARDLFEEARSVLEQEYGPCHSETLGVCSNLAGTYDALGRLDEAIKLLEYVVKMREEQGESVHPDVYDEKQRLAELLKEVGRVSR